MQRWRVRRRPRIGCSGPHARRFRRDPTTAGARRVDEAITRSQAAGGGMNRRKHPETEPGCWRQRRGLRPPRWRRETLLCCPRRPPASEDEEDRVSMVLTTLLCHPALVPARSLWEAGPTTLTW